MAVSLQKGGRVSLDKEAPGLKNIHVGLGWDARVADGQDFDLDASAFLVDASGKVLNDQSFVFYGNLKATDGSVEHTGDNLTGEGDGDDEVLYVYLEKLPATVAKVVFAVTIHEADKRHQNFGMVQNAAIRLLNKDSNAEVVRFDLGEDFSTETAVVFGEIYRHASEWKFNAIGQGYSGGLRTLALQYGVNVD